MAIKFLRQFITHRTPVTAGSASPSGNQIVPSPFTGGFAPRVNISGGPNSFTGLHPQPGPVMGPTLPFSTTTIGAANRLHVRHIINRPVSNFPEE